MLEAEARERQLATLKQNTPLGKKLTNGVSEAPEPRQADDSPLLKKLSNGANESAAAAHAQNMRIRIAAMTAERHKAVWPHFGHR